MINLFQLETYPDEKSNSSEDTAIRYHDSDSWPAHPPVGMWFNYGILNDFLKEWTLRKDELKSGAIARDEYFESIAAFWYTPHNSQSTSQLNMTGN